MDPRSTMNPVAKFSREKATTPSKHGHISAADASNATKTHKKQVTQEPDKRAKYGHREANIDKPSGPHAAIGSNHLEAEYVHHTLELSSCLCSYAQPQSHCPRQTKHKFGAITNQTLGEPRTHGCIPRHSESTLCCIQCCKQQDIKDFSV